MKEKAAGEESKQSNAHMSPVAMLDHWSKREWKDGIQITDLRELDTLSVETMHHKYEITIIDPSTAEVLIRGGEQFPERTVAYLSGASMGGSFLKAHGIYVGFKMELQIGKRRIITSTVRSIGLL
jgi:hypothetical protein